VKLNKLHFLIIAFLIITLPSSLADDDEIEEDENEEREGFGEMEREREREHNDDDEISIGSDTGNLILYVTLGAIAATIGYTAFKILKSKRPMSSKK
jgi:hypothetical protein